MQGSWRDDLREGNGTCVLHCNRDDGSTARLVYEGEWLRDKANGYGTMKYPDGTTASGKFQDDRLHGFCTLYLSNGDIVKGVFSHGSLNSRNCVRWNADGSYEEGICSSDDGANIVLGRYVSSDNCVEYIGQFMNRMPHGYGKLLSSSAKMIGQFQSGKLHGNAYAEWTEPVSGDVLSYSGEWQNDAMHGKGKLQWRGGYCEGKFNNGKAEGLCVVHDSVAGETYEGEMHNGVRDGNGVLTLSSAKRTVRSKFANNCPCSCGSITSKQHAYEYFGELSKSAVPSAHGLGKMRFQTEDDRKIRHDRVFRGEFRNNRWVQSEAEPSLCRLYGQLQAFAGQDKQLVIQARDELGNIRLSGGERFAASVRGTSPAVLSVKDRQNGIHELNIRVNKAGRHSLHVTLDDESVGDSPYPFAVFAADADPRQSMVSIGCSASGEITADVHGRDRYGNETSALTLQPYLLLSCCHGKMRPVTPSQPESDENGETPHATLQCAASHSCLWTLQVCTSSTDCAIGNTPRAIQVGAEPNALSTSYENAQETLPSLVPAEVDTDDNEEDEECAPSCDQNDNELEEERLARYQPELPLVTKLEDLHLVNAFRKRFQQSSQGNQTGKA